MKMSLAFKKFIKGTNFYLWASILIWAMFIILALYTFQGAWLSLEFGTQITILGMLLAIGLFTLNRVKIKRG